MSDGFLPFTRREVRLLDTPEGMARVLWRRVRRDMRLYNRAEQAQWEHDVMWGRGPIQPLGILNAGGVTRRAR